MPTDSPRTALDFQEGATLLVDKPLRWTSFDVVNKIRFRFKKSLGIKKIKVGHAGTLDPMATGLLLICTGKATKTLQDLQGFDKTYTGSLLLGATTPSYDSEFEVDKTFPTDHITPDLIEAQRQLFIGEMEQLPPMFSAIKVDGQPLYKQARKGKTVEVEPRKVVIKQFKITAIRLPYLDFEVTCSKGTYIRSLAYDFGKALQSGAYLTELRRTKIGDFDLKEAWKLEELIAFLDAQTPTPDDTL